MSSHKRNSRSCPGSALSPMPPKRIFITKDIPSLSRQSRSQPIPIKKCGREAYDSDDEVDTAQYDLATWNMYVLITNARRLRAHSRRARGCGHCSTYQTASSNEIPSLVSELNRTVCQGFDDPVSSELHSSSCDEFYHDCGVFDLDPM
ncbi:hypothetical protein HJC23_007815 [Cyclotella cryptica]|uniref:Uncharacterized protein n=1 Tax=Cyclotella cryptica TaxID=29204 RepID=A0ABD3QZR5_9STRA